MPTTPGAILAADVVGYTRLMGHDETGTFHRLTAEDAGTAVAKVRASLFCAEPPWPCPVVKLMGGGTLRNRSEVLGVEVGQEPVEGLRLLDVH